VDAKIINIFGSHKFLTPHSIEKFLVTAIYLFWQHIQLFINSVLRLIEGGTEEHEEVMKFKH